MKTKQKQLTTFNIMNDAMFKALFRSMEARGVVSTFLSKITGIDKDILFNAKYVAGEIPKKKIYEKGKISDCIVLIDDKNRIIVEMNQFINDFTFDKGASYAFSNIIELTRPNMSIYPKVILINIDNENKFNTDKPILSFKMRDEDGNIETEMYNSIHLILDNIVNNEYNIDKEIKKFSKLLKLTTLEEIENEFKGDGNYMAAFRKIEDLTYDPEFAGAYDIEEARKQDLYFTHKSGFNQGIKQGIEKANKKNAKAMLKDKVDINLISKYTGLSIEEIKSL